jgi:hypothetical protein
MLPDCVPFVTTRIKTPNVQGNRRAALPLAK